MLLEQVQWKLAAWILSNKLEISINTRSGGNYVWVNLKLEKQNVERSQIDSSIQMITHNHGSTQKHKVPLSLSVEEIHSHPTFHIARQWCCKPFRWWQCHIHTVFMYKHFGWDNLRYVFTDNRMQFSMYCPLLCIFVNHEGHWDFVDHFDKCHLCYAMLFETDVQMHFGKSHKVQYNFRQYCSCGPWQA